MTRWIYTVPVAAFALLAFFMFRSLVLPAPDMIPSALIDKPAPVLVVPPLDATTQGFGPRELAAGHVTVVNVFASWCVPCRGEAPVLAQLAGMKGFALYGLVQKDTPSNIHGFLTELGNPFQRIALDADGRASIEWGVYGVPETFVVDGKGIVRFKLVGGLTQDALRSQLLPAIAAARQAS